MKRILTIMLSLLMVFTAIPFCSVGVTAAEASESGYVGWYQPIVSFEFLNMPDLKCYYSGDTSVFDFEGIKIRATLDDGTAIDYVGDCDNIYCADAERNLRFLNFEYSVDEENQQIQFEFETVSGEPIAVSTSYTKLKVSDIKITRLPYDAEELYIANTSEYFNPYGLKFNIYLENGCVKNIREDFSWFNPKYYFNNEEIDSSFTPASGENEITVSWGDCSDSFVVNTKEIVDFEISQMPYNTKRIIGETFSVVTNLNGLEFQATYSDGSKEPVEFFDLEIYGDNIVDDYLTVVEGDNEITYDYYGKTVTLTVTGVNVVDFEILTEPTQNYFIAGQGYYIEHFLSGMTIKITYSDGTSFVYNAEDGYMNEIFYNCINEDGYGKMVPQVGENVITVNYAGASDSFTVIGKEVTDVNIITPPKGERVFANSDYIDIFEGIEINFTYADGTSEILNFEEHEDFIEYSVNLSGEGITEDYYGDYYYDFVPGDNLVTLECNGCTDTFNIYFYTIDKIEVTKLPNVTTYEADEIVEGGMEIFDGIEITAYRTDGKIDVVNDLHELSFSGKSLGGPFIPALGENKINVHYGDKYGTFIVYGVKEEVAGDVNNDESINVLDATYIQLQVAKFILSDVDINVSNADVDKDGELTIRDATAIQMYVAKLIPNFDNL